MVGIFSSTSMIATSDLLIKGQRVEFEEGINPRTGRSKPSR
jgi:hypothetical protein